MNNADRVLFGAAKANASSGVYAAALLTVGLDSRQDERRPPSRWPKRIAITALADIRPIGSITVGNGK